MITAASMYEANHNAIEFLSKMIENANGRDVSAAGDELIKLLDEQIELVKVGYEETWEVAQESTE